jgi:lipopolysaccharide biosynthesis glycosyltransferase
MIEIPVVFYFDNNYVMPAGVAFYSLLYNANKKYFYKFYVLHSNITNENQARLQNTISVFGNVSLDFVDMNNRLDTLWDKLGTKGHFSKETFYKMLTASLFPQYDKVITSDVDVVFLGDISGSYFSIDEKEPYYVAGIKPVGKIMYYFDMYKQWFSGEEIGRMTFCGGYLVMNLQEIRKDDLEAKFIDCFEKNVQRLNQADQDILNLCCYPKVKYLPCSSLVCSYFYDLYKDDQDFKNDAQYSETELRHAYDNPIQLHYATSTKPWNDVFCTKSEEWFKYLVKTPFLKDFWQKNNKKTEFNYRILVSKEFNCGKKYRISFEIRKKFRDDK